MKKGLKMKIRQKLTLGFAAVAIAVALVGYVSLNASQKALQESIAEHSSIFVHKTLDTIDRNIYNRIELIQAYSKDLTKKKILLESNREFEKLDNAQKYID